MKQAIGMHVGGIKCDNKECDYRDDSVKMENYTEWLNKPCPRCHENLLIEKDYNKLMNITKLIELMNKVLPFQKEDDNEEKFMLKLEMNGTGNVAMKIEEVENEDNN